MNITAGTAVDFNPNRQAPNTSDFNEFDYFIGVSGMVAKRVKLGVQYSQFISGQNAYADAKNIEFSVGYVDGAADAKFHVNPYAKLFWSVDGVSTAGLGKAGNTFDVEIGAVPTVSLGSVTLLAPTWFTVGPKSYFGPIDDGNFGVFSTGLKVVKALDFGPKAGKWSIYAMAQYYNLANDNLLAAKKAFNQGDGARDHLQIGAGVSVGF